MKNELMNKIAEKYKKTVAQISIRWSIQNNFASIPKSKTKKYIKENFEVLDFNLTADEMQSIKGLNNNTHTCWNPNDILY
jgi:diketogulonate reductase-like aldo/keto reductase